MEQEIRDILEREFGPADISKRTERGKTLSYVEHGLVTRRLNEAVGADGWQYEKLDMIQMPEEVIVEVRLGIKLDGEWVWKTQYGSARVMYYKNKEKTPENMISLGDNLKSAMSDGIKKCASLLGVALHLYSDVKHGAETDEDAPEQSPDATDAAKGADDKQETQKPTGSAGGGMGATPVVLSRRAAMMREAEVLAQLKTDGRTTTRGALRVWLLGEGKTSIDDKSEAWDLYKGLLDDENNWAEKSSVLVSEDL